MKRTYGAAPKVIGVFNTTVQEFMFYQDMLIKHAGWTMVKTETRLDVFDPIVTAALNDFINEYGLAEAINRYIYISAKNLYQDGKSYNREGWHCDGFGSSDVNYIWSNSQPTVFNMSNFDLSDDDTISMREMAEQADPKNNLCYDNNTLLRLDQHVVHKVNPSRYTGVRAFLKISFSRDKFDLIGNAINPRLDYDWQMRPRGEVRNIPQSKQSK